MKVQHIAEVQEHLMDLYFGLSQSYPQLEVETDDRPDLHKEQYVLVGGEINLSGDLNSDLQDKGSAMGHFLRTEGFTDIRQLRAPDIKVYTDKGLARIEWWIRQKE